jgi:hypothetical protein
LGTDANQNRNNNNKKTSPERKDLQDEKIDTSAEEQKEVDTVLSNLRARGKEIVQLQLPSKFLQVSKCNIYKKIRILWPINENGELVDDVSPIVLPHRKINEEYSDIAKSMIKKAYQNLSAAQKKSLANKFADYPLKIPFGKCGT